MNTHVLQIPLRGSTTKVMRKVCDQYLWALKLPRLKWIFVTFREAREHGKLASLLIRLEGYSGFLTVIYHGAVTMTRGRNMLS